MAVVRVSSFGAHVATLRSKRAEGGNWGSIQPPHTTEPSVDTLYTLRPPQRLAGRGLILRSVPEFARGGERHREGSCHARQRVK